MGSGSTRSVMQIWSPSDSLLVLTRSRILSCLLPFAFATICDTRKGSASDRQTNKEYCGMLHLIVQKWCAERDEHNTLTIEQDYSDINICCFASEIEQRCCYEPV